MRICNLRKYDGTWMWRTVEGNTGLYYTAAHGKGIFFMRDDQKYVNKMCTYEKFSSCKTASGTRRKLNRIFAELDHVRHRKTITSSLGADAESFDMFSNF